MLGDHPIAPVLLARDLAAAREFYHGKLGLLIEKKTRTPSCSGAAAAPTWT
jgi:catechol 2,3-dioxygenase-like lactoylglutathione lyase family enzyme